MSDLPFLKARKVASVIIARRKPDGAIESEKEEGEEDPAMLSVAEELISAVHSKDATRVAAVLEAAFDIIGSKAQSSMEMDGGDAA